MDTIEKNNTMRGIMEIILTYDRLAARSSQKSLENFRAAKKNSHLIVIKKRDNLFSDSSMGVEKYFLDFSIP